ncbi:MAG: DUF4421 family protein [Flavobacteriaceae bacterium]
MLRTLATFWILLFAVNASAQIFSKERIDSIFTNPMHNDSLYIKEYHQQLNINFNISNDFSSYRIPVDGFDGVVKPNVHLRYALDFNYKFATLRLGLRTKGSEKSREEKGESDYLRIRLQFIFKNWAHNWQFNRIEGYYLSNSDDLLNSDSSTKITFPNMTSYIFHGQSYRKLNPRYSIKAVSSQTEAQLKSAGTWMPRFEYWYYFIDGLDQYRLPDGTEVDQENYQSTNGFSLLSFLGYHYTFVRKKFYANAYLDLGFGYDYNYRKQYENNVSTGGMKQNDFVYSTRSGLNLGYNSSSFFFGGNVNSNVIKYAGDSTRNRILSNNISFNIFVGHRFKAPKKVTQGVDFIEKNVPLIHDNN